MASNNKLWNYRFEICEFYSVPDDEKFENVDFKFVDFIAFLYKCFKQILHQWKVFQFDPIQNKGIF